MQAIGERVNRRKKLRTLVLWQPSRKATETRSQVEVGFVAGEGRFWRKRF